MLVTVAVIGAAALLSPNMFIRGLVVGAGTVGAVAAGAVLVLLATGTAQTSMGATAERWTASELRPLRKIGGRVVNYLALLRGDIDHVAILPSGLFAVESKWSGSGWDLDKVPDHLARAIDQARSNARTLGLWQPVRGVAVGEVQSVLFLWGGTDVVKPTQPRRIHGVDVVYGLQAAKVWRSAVGRPDSAQRVEPEKIETLWLAISSHIRGRDTYDEEHNPRPPALSEIYGNTLLAAGIAIAAILACLKAYLVIHPEFVFMFTAVAAVAAGLVVRRVAIMRIAGLAWALGTAGGLALLASSELLDRIFAG